MITDAKQITPEWLTTRLRANGRLPTGEASSVTLGEPFESTGANWTPVAVEYDGADEDAPQSLMFKLLHKERYDGGYNEVVLYTDFAAQMPDPPVGALYDFAHDEDTRALYLLLQDISKTHKLASEGIGPDDYVAATRSLLEFHTYWWQHDRLREARFEASRWDPMRMANACSEENVRANALNFREKELPKYLAERADLPDGGLAILERALDRWADVFCERIADGEALTLIHGDSHVMNMLFPRDQATQRVLLVDFETYRRGLGAYDLAYMMFFRDAEHRRELEAVVLPAYYDGLVAAGVTSYSHEQLERDYRLSVIACLFPPLSWDHGGARQALAAFDDWDCADLLA